MIKSINELTPPNLANMALVADVQAYEPYGSAALNRQMRGVLSKGVYSGFNVVPSTGLKINVTSSGVSSAAAVEVSDKWLITVRQQSDVVLTVPAGRLSSVVLKAFYDGQTITNQVDADSTVKASELLVVNAGAEPADSLILCQVNVPSNAVTITADMISYDKRDRVSLEGFWNKLDSEHIAPKGQWFRTILNKGIKPSLDNVRAAAVDTIGTTNSWFQEVWANKYRGGSIDVEGTIRSGGKLAMLQGDFGIGSTSKQLTANTDLNNLPLENGKYRGVTLLNTPEGAAASSSWWFIDHECHNVDHQIQRAVKFAAVGHYGVWYRVKLNGVWGAWDCQYSVNNKPTKSDVGLSNVANERQYSSQNNNIGSGATNYAAGNHNHDLVYSKLGHKHVWSDITDPPVHATRWPTLAEIGAQPAGSYAAASHTHPWSQITGAPVYTTRWPTLAEIGAQPAGSYAAASHTHPWAQVTGAPVYTTRWPTWAEVTGKPNTFDYVRGLTTDDLNTVVALGWYDNPSDSQATAAKNYPTAQAGRLEVYPAGSMVYQTYTSYATGIVNVRSRYNGVWNGWKLQYSESAKPSLADLGAAAASHTHPWSQITGAPVYTTRWPTLAEIGAQPAGSYAAASHTHPWAQVTGAPVYTTRWPTWAEVTGKPATMAPSAHTHPWSEITGAPVYTTRWPTLAEIGASDNYGWRGQTVTFEVGGDANTYYPVIINKGHSSITFGMDEIQISRGYSAKAPSTWNTSTHKGGLTLAIAYSGDSSWGGNDKLIRVSHFAENYSNMVGGLALSASGLVVWLRGGGAEYKLNTQYGLAATATPQLGGFTGGDSNVYSPRTSYSAALVDSEVRSKMPLRSYDVYDNNQRVYSPHNKPTYSDVGAAAASHTHAWSQITGAPAYATRWPTLAEIGAQAAGSYAAASHTHAWSQITGAPAYATRWPTLAEIGAQAAGSYAAASHTHAWAQVTGAPVYTTRWPSWAEVSGKPSTMAPSAHGHGGADVTALANRLSVSGEGMVSANNTDRRQAGMYGIYDAARIGHIWSMGTSFQVHPSGTDFGSLYGLAYKHTNNPTGGTMAGGHQMVWCVNGVPKAAMGDGGVWTAGTVYEAGQALSARYAAISHSHPWSQITGVPVQATRWPNASEVGLGNVPNTVHSANPDASTVAVRDSAADIQARLFRSNYQFEASMAGGIAFRNSTTDNYIRFCSSPDAVRNWIGAAPASHTHSWAQITGAPVYTTRWPTWSEVSGKPTTMPPSAHTHNAGRTFTELFSYSGGMTSGDFVLSQAYSNFDGLVIITSGDDSAYYQSAEIASFIIDQLASVSGTKNYHLIAYSNYNWSGRFAADKRSFSTGAQSCRIHKIYGYSTVTQ